MGLLDDAIREHLDLKRRRGADPAEIERAEREALGPVRRDPIAGEEGADAPEFAVGAAPEHGLPADHGELHPDQQPYGDELAEDEEWDDYEDDEYEDDEDHPEPGHAAPSPDSAGHAALPEPNPHPEPAPPPPLAEDLEATQVHEIHPPAATPEHHGPDDVLEETPDFLQDTPDHDRLWFEQRPPKDFDFDE